MRRSQAGFEVTSAPCNRSGLCLASCRLLRLLPPSLSCTEPGRFGVEALICSYQPLSDSGAGLVRQRLSWARTSARCWGWADDPHAVASCSILGQPATAAAARLSAAGRSVRAATQSRYGAGPAASRCRAVGRRELEALATRCPVASTISSISRRAGAAPPGRWTTSTVPRVERAAVGVDGGIHARRPCSGCPGASRSARRPSSDRRRPRSKVTRS